MADSGMEIFRKPSAPKPTVGDRVKGAINGNPVETEFLRVKAYSGTGADRTVRELTAVKVYDSTERYAPVRLRADVIVAGEDRRSALVGCLTAEGYVALLAQCRADLKAAALAAPTQKALAAANAGK